MILPNKVFSFHECVLSKVIYVLEKLDENYFDVYELYKKTETHFEDLNEFILALDVLFVLEKIELDSNSKRIKYAKKNNL